MRVGVSLPLLLAAAALAGCGNADLLASERVLPADPEPPPEEPEEVRTPTFRVDAARLRDRCGREVMLRGANEMVAWSPGRDGAPAFEEMAKTGANAVRIVWVSTASAEALDRALDSARAAGLIPIVELHDGQGNFDMLPALVDFWTAPETVAVVAKHERALLVEIGGGLGGVVPRDQWEEGYRQAIAALRSAGIRTPIIVHAPDYGNHTARLLESGPTLLDADPAGNLLFAFSAWAGSAADASEALEQLIRAGVPVFVAEFSAYLINGCPNFPFDYSVLLETAARLRVGWFAWSWGGVVNIECSGALDMTTDGTLAGLHGWGLDVALGSSFGISRTSSLVEPGCGAEP